MGASSSSHGLGPDLSLSLSNTPNPAVKKKLRYGHVSVDVQSSSDLHRSRLAGEAPHYVIQGSCSGLLHGTSSPFYNAAIRRVTKELEEIGTDPKFIPLYDSKVQAFLLIQHTMDPVQGGMWNIVATQGVFSRHSGTFVVLGDKGHAQASPYELRLGDCFRLGSVGLVVTEIGGGGQTTQKLAPHELQHLEEAAVAFQAEEVEVEGFAVLAEEEAEGTQEDSESDEEEDNDDDVEEEAVGAESGGYWTRTSESASATCTASVTVVTATATCTLEHLEVLDQGAEFRASPPTLPCSPAEGPKKKREARNKEKYGTIGASGASSGEEERRSRSRSRGRGRGRAQKGTGNGARQFCYMCFETSNKEDPLVSACACKGDTKYMHVQCFRNWLQHSRAQLRQAQVIRTTGKGAPACKICGTAYKLKILRDGQILSLLDIQPSAAAYIMLVVVTQHANDDGLFKTQFRVNFAGEAASGRAAGGSGGNNVDAGNNTVTVGRHHACNMLLPHRTISTTHAAISYKNGKYFLEDRGSSNGTHAYLRTSMPIPWDVTTRIRVGKSTIALQPVRNRWSEWRYCLAKFGRDRALSSEMLKQPHSVEKWVHVMNSSAGDSSDGLGGRREYKVGEDNADPPATAAAAAAAAKKQHSPPRNTFSRTYVGYTRPVRLTTAPEVVSAGCPLPPLPPPSSFGIASPPAAATARDQPEDDRETLSVVDYSMLEKVHEETPVTAGYAKSSGAENKHL